MVNKKRRYPPSGFYGIGIMQVNHQHNIGTLWRSAYVMGASFIFTVDEKYKRQSSDVVSTPAHIPLYHYDSLADLKNHLPHGAPLIGVEMSKSAVMLNEFEHPARAVYLLGSESNGLSKNVIEQCHRLIQLPGNFSLNVAVAGSIIMHDRICKIPHSLPQISEN